MKADLYIGPLIERSGKFSYDTFTLADGRRSSFRYARVEQARYDRRTMVAEAGVAEAGVAEAGSGPQDRVHVCETSADFDHLVRLARCGEKGSGAI